MDTEKKCHVESMGVSLSLLQHSSLKKNNSFAVMARRQGCKCEGPETQAYFKTFQSIDMNGIVKEKPLF